MRITILSVTSLLCAASFSSCETTETAQAPAVKPAAVRSVTAPAAPAAPAAPTVKPYPLSNCLVTEEALDSKGTPETFIHKGQEIKVCCQPCKLAFKMNPEVYLAKL